MKSIHFATPPTLNGKRTMRYTDVTVENFKPKMLGAIHRREMRGEDDEGVELVEHNDHLASWDCHYCIWWEATGIWRPHRHEYD